jgi:hypothetical protein
VVQLDHSPAPDTQWLAEPGHGGLTVGVFGGLGEPDLPFLRRLQHHASSSLAIALDVDAWAPHLPVQPGPGSAAHLTSTGWRSVTLGPRDRLDTAWQELGLMQSRATASAGAAR